MKIHSVLFGAVLALLAGTALAHPGHDGAGHPAHLWPLMVVLAVAAIGVAGAGARWRARLPSIAMGGAVVAAALLMLSHL